MFFESALKGKNAFWRYVVMFIVVFAATNIVGALPLVLVLIFNSVKNPEVLDASSDNLMDLSIYGIDPNTGLVLMIFPFIIGLITFMLLMKPMHERSVMTVFNGSKSIRWKKFLLSALVWLSLMGIYLYFSISNNPGNFTINNTSTTLIWLVIIAIFLMPFQTTLEEILFRGYLMQGAGTWFGNKWLPLIITSLLFGLMHGFNPEVKDFGFWIMMPQYVLFGLVFGILTIFDDGIELAMGAHAANNVFLSIFITHKSSALQTAAVYEQKDVYPWADFLSLLLISVLFISLMGILNKWCLKGKFKINCES